MRTAEGISLLVFWVHRMASPPCLHSHTLAQIYRGVPSSETLGKSVFKRKKVKIQSTRFNLSHLVSENVKSAWVLHSVLGFVLGGKMPFSWCKLLQHLMKLHLPWCRNKLMTKLLKLMKYQKNSRTLFAFLKDQLWFLVHDGFYWAYL